MLQSPAKASDTNAEAVKAINADPRLAELVMLLQENPDLMEGVRKNVTEGLESPESKTSPNNTTAELARLRSVLFSTETSLGGDGFIGPGTVDTQTRLRLDELRELGEHDALPVVVAGAGTSLSQFGTLADHAIGEITVGNGDKYRMTYKSSEDGTKCVLIIRLDK